VSVIMMAEARSCLTAAHRCCLSSSIAQCRTKSHSLSVVSNLGS